MVWLCSCLPCSKVVRKSIARVLTVISQSQRTALRKAYTNKVRVQRMRFQRRAMAASP